MNETTRNITLSGASIRWVGNLALFVGKFLGRAGYSRELQMSFFAVRNVYILCPLLMSALI